MNPDSPCLSYVVIPVPSLVDSVQQAACLFSLLTDWVDLCRQARHLCEVTWGESFSTLGSPWITYRKRFSPATSSKCGSCMLILCASTLEPRTNRCVNRTKVMEIPLFIYPHVFDYGCFHFVARRMVIFFSVASASTSSSLSTEATEGENCNVSGGRPQNTYFLCLCCLLKTLLWCLW